MGALSKNTRFKYLCYLTAFLLFLDMMPYFWWWSQTSSYINYAVKLITCAIFLMNHSSIQKNNTGLMVLFVLMCFLYAFRSSLASLVLTIPLVFIPFAPTKFLQGVFKAFTTIYCIIIGLALVSWLLLLLGLNSPIGTVMPLNSNDFEYYTVYPIFLVTSNFFDIETMFRFAGSFDEPGMVGTFSALLLFANSFSFKNWKTYVLLLSGIASFSLYFYVVLVIGLVPYLLGRKKVSVLVLAVIAFAALYLNTKDNEIMGRLIWDRLEWDTSENRIVGADRTQYEAEKIYKSKKGTIEFWIGLDNYESYRIIARGSNSYQNIVMHNGMVFLLAYILFFVLYARSVRTKTSSYVVFLILFIACIYQRPQVLSSAYLFIYVCLAKRETFELNSIETKKKEQWKIIQLQ